MGTLARAAGPLRTTHLTRCVGAAHTPLPHTQRRGARRVRDFTFTARDLAPPPLPMLQPGCEASCSKVRPGFHRGHVSREHPQRSGRWAAPGLCPHLLADAGGGAGHSPRPSAPSPPSWHRSWALHGLTCGPRACRPAARSCRNRSHAPYPPCSPSQLVLRPLHPPACPCLPAGPLCVQPWGWTRAGGPRACNTAPKEQLQPRQRRQRRRARLQHLQPLLRGRGGSARA